MKTVITAAQLITPERSIEAPRVVVEDERIAAIGTRDALATPAGAREVDYPGLILAPGFIDIHVHGGGGHDVMEADGIAMAAIEKHMARHGVTTYLATTVTASQEKILRALEYLGQSINQGNRHGRARPVGIHLEGPFISHAKRGVHPPDNLVMPSPELLDRFWKASAGTLRMMTIAPEVPGAIETIRRAKELGIISSLGHSDASFPEAAAGISAGATHATHTFNAMRSLDHREPGILGAVLTDDRVTADIISDGIHLHPNIVKLFLHTKGIERSVLITDAISAAGMPDGRYRLGAFEVDVKDGRCDFQGKLAGSVLALDCAVRNAMSFAEWTLQQVVRMATLNPARVLGRSDDCGVLAPGRLADLAVLTPEGEVVKTIAAGQVVGE